MTLLEIMVVLAIIAGMLFIARSGFRVLTRADLVEDATDVTALVKAANELAIGHGEQHRVLFDLDKGIYTVEVCEGAVAVARNEKTREDEEDVKRALEKGKQRVEQLTQDMGTSGAQSPFGQDPAEATKRLLALSGQHVQDRTCHPPTDGLTGDSSGKGWLRTLRVGKGVKFKEIWVAHRDEAVTKGQVAIYFFPNGSAEKALVEVADGDDIFTLYVYGLTGRVELRDGAPRNVDDHMLRNAMGDKDAKREDAK